MDKGDSTKERVESQSGNIVGETTIDGGNVERKDKDNSNLTWSHMSLLSHP